MANITAVVSIESLRDNPYFAHKAATIFDQVTYLPERPGSAELERALEQHDVIIIGAREQISATMLSPRTRANLVGTLSIGTDHLDVAALRQRGIEVITSPTANVRSVAEHNIALVFALAKRLKDGDRALATGQGRSGLQGSAFELQGKTAGLVGYGNVGKATANILTGIGLDVIATSRTRLSGNDGVIRFTSLKDLLPASHLVILAVPLTSGTQGLIGKTAIDNMRPNALLVNTSRPDVVDNSAVRSALEDGRLGGFGADYDDDVEELTNLSNAIITPHIAGLTSEASDRLDNELIDRIQAFLVHSS